MRVEAQVVSPDKGRLAKSIFLVDSGAWYTVLRKSLADELGLKPVMKGKPTLTDKREVEVDLSPAYIKVMNREVASLVVTLDVPEPLFGVETLEALGLKLDPTTGKREVTRPYTTLLV